MYSVSPENPERRWKGPEHGCASIVLTLLSLAGLAGLIPYWILGSLAVSDSGLYVQWERFWYSPYRIIDAVLLGVFVIWVFFCIVRRWHFREIALNLGGVVGCYIYVTLAPFLW